MKKQKTENHNRRKPHKPKFMGYLYPVYLFIPLLFPSLCNSINYITVLSNLYTCKWDLGYNENGEFLDVCFSKKNWRSNRSAKSIISLRLSLWVCLVKRGKFLRGEKYIKCPNCWELTLKNIYPSSYLHFQNLFKVLSIYSRVNQFLKVKVRKVCQSNTKSSVTGFKTILTPFIWSLGKIIVNKVINKPLFEPHL